MAENLQAELDRPAQKNLKPSAQPADAAGRPTAQTKRKRVEPAAEPEEEVDFGFDDAEPSAQQKLKSIVHDPAASASHSTAASSQQPSRESSEAPQPNKPPASKLQLAKRMKWAVAYSHDHHINQQGNTTTGWLNMLEQDAPAYEVPLDSMVSLFREEHLGPKTLGIMATWLSSHRNAVWSDFKAALTARFPGMPPTVTRHTWKQLSTSNQGGYHAYVTEFNRQKALISTGPDEVIETFLQGLTSQLRSQIEFCKNRAWRADEFEELVSMTTERVNSIALSTSSANSANSSSRITVPRSAR